MEVKIDISEEDYQTCRNALNLVEDLSEFTGRLASAIRDGSVEHEIKLGDIVHIYNNVEDLYGIITRILNNGVCTVMLEDGSSALYYAKDLTTVGPNYKNLVKELLGVIRG